MLEEILNKEEKMRIARLILESLTEWFEVPETREQYIKESKDRIMVAAFEDDKPIGFLCLKETGKETVELAVMGVLKDHHRNGVGKSLLKKAIHSCRSKQLRWVFMMTMTKPIFSI